MLEYDYWGALAKNAELRVKENMRKEQKGFNKMSTKLIIVLSSDDDQPLKDDEISMFATELSYRAHADWGYRAYVEKIIDTKKENK